MGDIAWFERGRFGLFFHFGIYTAAGIDPSWPLMQGLLSYDEYAALADRFRPSQYDPATWAALAKQAGAAYVVLTAKHHDGFALWDTQLSDFSAPKHAADRDLVAPFVEAVRAAGLKVGLYFSLPDWHTPDYPVTPTLLGTRPPKAWPPNAYTSIAADPARWQRYLDFMRGQLRELLTNYGQIDLLWFDGGWEHTVPEWQGYDLVKMIRELQPGIILNDRLSPSLAGVATRIDPGLSDYIECEMALPAPQTNDPWERAISLSDSWSYNPRDRNFKSSAQLIRTLAETVSGGGTMLLDLGPRADGTIQGDFVSRLRVVGDWLSRQGESIYGAGKAPVAPLDSGIATACGDMAYLHVFGVPSQNSVEVRGLAREVLDARILATGRPLAWEQQIDLYLGIMLRLHVPPLCLDADDTVIALRLAPGA